MKGNTYLPYYSLKWPVSQLSLFFCFIDTLRFLLILLWSRPCIIKFSVKDSLKYLQEIITIYHQWKVTISFQVKLSNYQNPNRVENNSKTRICFPNQLRSRQQQPTPVLLPGEFHGWRSLVGYSPWGRHDWATSLLLFSFIHWRRKWQPNPVFLPGESQGQRSLVGCHIRGHTESDTTETT